MLVNPQFACDPTMFAILAVIGDSDPTPKNWNDTPGVFVIGHFSLDNLVVFPPGTSKFDYTYPDFDEEYHEAIPASADDEDDMDGHGYFNSYGVCDSPEQFMQYVGELLKRDERSFAVSFTHIEKVPGSEGGWRWHKWGPYIGTGTPTTEYLADEKEFDQGVWVYHVIQLAGPLFVPEWKKRLNAAREAKILDTSRDES